MFLPARRHFCSRFSLGALLPDAAPHCLGFGVSIKSVARPTTMSRSTMSRCLAMHTSLVSAQFGISTSPKVHERGGIVCPPSLQARRTQNLRRPRSAGRSEWSADSRHGADLHVRHQAIVTVDHALGFHVRTLGLPAPTQSLRGLLPRRVSNNTVTGTFSGMPKPGTQGTNTLSITASNAFGSTTQTFTLTVTAHREARAVDRGVAPNRYPTVRHSRATEPALRHRVDVCGE